MNRKYTQGTNGGLIRRTPRGFTLKLAIKAGRTAADYPGERLPRLAPDPSRSRYEPHVGAKQFAKKAF